MLSTSGRGIAKATVPGIEKDGSWYKHGWRADIRQDAIPEQVVCIGRRHEAGTGKEGVGSGDRQATGREKQKAEAERDGTPRGGRLAAASRSPGHLLGSLLRAPGVSSRS